MGAAAETASHKVGQGLGAAVGAPLRTAAKGVGKKIGNIVESAGTGLKDSVKGLFESTPKTGFGGAAYKNGFQTNVKKTVDKVTGKVTEHGEADIKAAVKNFDKIKRTKGIEAAKGQFGGAKPNWFLHRDGIAKSLTGLAAVGTVGELRATNNVQDELLPPKQ